MAFVPLRGLQPFCWPQQHLRTGASCAQLATITTLASRSVYPSNVNTGVRHRATIVSQAAQKTSVLTYSETVAREMLSRACTKAAVSADAQERIVELASLLVVAGETHNLSGVRTLSGALVIHAVDALALLPTVDGADVRTIVDVGAGAGFPGLVLAIARPNMHVTLVEATRKKVDFQTHAISTLQLHNAEPIWSRAEDFGRREGRQSFDCAVARAVARLNMLSELAIPLVRPDGLFIAQKSMDTTQAEVTEAERAIRKLGGKLSSVDDSWTEIIVQETAEEYGEPQESTDLRHKCLVVVEKVKDTPAQYPRLHNAIKKKPL